MRNVGDVDIVVGRRAGRLNIERRLGTSLCQCSAWAFAIIRDSREILYHRVANFMSFTAVMLRSSSDSIARPDTPKVHQRPYNSCIVIVAAVRHDAGALMEDSWERVGAILYIE